MKIERFKRKGISMSIYAIIIGIIIMLIGFGREDFKMSNLKQLNTHKWYQTISFGNEGASYSLIKDVE